MGLSRSDSQERKGIVLNRSTKNVLFFSVKKTMTYSFRMAQWLRNNCLIVTNASERKRCLKALQTFGCNGNSSVLSTMLHSANGPDGRGYITGQNSGAENICGRNVSHAQNTPSFVKNAVSVVASQPLTLKRNHCKGIFWCAAKTSNIETITSDSTISTDAHVVLARNSVNANFNNTADSQGRRWSSASLLKRDSISGFHEVEQLISQEGAVDSTSFMKCSANHRIGVETKSLRYNFWGVETAKKKCHSIYRLVQFMRRQIVRHNLTCNFVFVITRHVNRYEYSGVKSWTCWWNVSSSHWKL